MRHPLAMAGLIAALFLAGCQTPALVGATPPGTNNQQTVPAPGPASAAKLGAYTFTPLSAAAAAALTNRAAGAATSAAPMAPEAAGAMPAADAVAGAKLVAPGSPYYHGSYFAGPYGPMKLESATEAKGPGAAGGWADVKAAVIAPVLADWATDGRLIATSGVLDAQGEAVTSGTESWPGELGWHATYASAARNEVLEFHVTAAGATITKLRWAPISLDLDAAAVDAKAAVLAVTKAITDKDAKSEEEKLGYDYFFGKDSVNPAVMGANPATVAIAPVAASAPAAAPDAEVRPIAIGIPVPAPVQLPDPKQLYELTAGGRWRASLQAINDKVVWEVSFDPLKYDVKSPDPDWALDNYAYGMVDAKNGTLVRFKRPMMYAIYRGEGGGTDSMPMPAADLATK